MPIVTQIFAGELVANSDNYTAQFIGADYLFMKAPGPTGDRPDWSVDGSFTEVDCALLVEVAPGFKRQVPLERGYISNREPLIIPSEVSGPGLPMELVLSASFVDTVEVFAVSGFPVNPQIPWVFSPSEPDTGSLWWEIDSSGLPLYGWAWRWNSTVNRWVSESQWRLSVSDAASNFKSGSFVQSFALDATEAFIESAEFRFFLDTANNDADWLFEVNEIAADQTAVAWVGAHLQGDPLRSYRLAELPIAQVRSVPPGGWGWKLSPVFRRGSVSFDVQLVLREVRANV